MTQKEIMMHLVDTTPGVVGDAVFKAHGIKCPRNIKSLYGLPIERVMNLGYRRVWA